jgi:nicotinate-nucleotide adenylyltransferase
VSAARRTGVLGGTFDPIHLGHIRVATAAADALGLDQVLLLPSRTPPHRPIDPSASIYHRFAMAALAAAGDTRLVTCDIELGRPGPSYTADTLRVLRASGLDHSQLFFLIGADAFAEIATWRDYPALLELAHFVVCSRPGCAAGTMPSRLPTLAARMVTLPSHAATAPASMHPRIYLLDASTPDISSTVIRARARTGQPLADLVAPDVDSYISRHGLYGDPADAVALERSAADKLHE